MSEPDQSAAAHAAEPGSPADVFRRLVQGVCDRQTAELSQLYAEQTSVRHPLDPQRAPALTTRQQLTEHFRGGFQALGEIRFTAAALTLHQTTDPEVIIGEFEYRGVMPGTGEPFDLPNIFVVRVRDGQIVRYDDYMDPIALCRLLGRTGELAEALSAAESPPNTASS